MFRKILFSLVAVMLLSSIAFACEPCKPKNDCYNDVCRPKCDYDCHKPVCEPKCDHDNKWCKPKCDYDYKCKPKCEPYKPVCKPYKKPWWCFWGDWWKDGCDQTNGYSGT